MRKPLIWLEAIIVTTIYLIIVNTIGRLIKFLGAVGNTADWHTQRNLRIWQSRKAYKIYEQELKEIHELYELERKKNGQ